MMTMWQTRVKHSVEINWDDEMIDDHRASEEDGMEDGGAVKKQNKRAGGVPHRDQVPTTSAYMHPRKRGEKLQVQLENSNQHYLK